MTGADARQVVEKLLGDHRLWLPALSMRRGFSSSRVEHLLNGLVSAMPKGEAYLEVGTLEGRTIEAASRGNPDKQLIAYDHEFKYAADPRELPANVEFRRTAFQTVKPGELPAIGVAFYDGDHDDLATGGFVYAVAPHLARQAVLVFDDWDRASVRQGVLSAAHGFPMKLVAELPSYTDGLTTAPNHFGWYFGVSVWAYERG